MSMGNGFCMPPMMLPPGMQHIRAPPMGPYSTMGLGMGMGMGYGMGMLDMNGSPLIPQFPCPSLPGAPGLHGMPGSAALQMFGIPGQGFPVPMPRPAQSSSFSMLPTKPNSVPEGSEADINPVPQSAAETVPSSSSKDQHHQSINSELPPKTSVHNSQIQASMKVISFIPELYFLFQSHIFGHVTTHHVFTCTIFVCCTKLGDASCLFVSCF